MTAAEIRASYLDFFKSKGHTIVPSAPLLPSSPNLMFTNAGMNQFVPYFLGTEPVPFDPARAADTQKCIRAGGKHNDLDDVGFDTYHHTFFEMLGNWSFGDYFKKEAIEWAWELMTVVWGFPANRIYASVYKPGPNDPAEFDQEAHDLWTAIFEKAGLDPAVQIVNGDKADNFWMMGDTGPCGPCSELHIDLTPDGDSGGKLVNMDDPRCIEVWNLVFIQYNAESDGTLRPLPATHVDTGMGFERICSIMQGTNGFTDFKEQVSNYNTDVFAPLFRKLENLSGKTYGGSMPATRDGMSEAEKVDVAFRVIADHIRTTGLSIADAILPGNNDRNYVIRRILRRAVRYGRTLGFTSDDTFLADLVPTLVAEMGDVFPELKEKQDLIASTLADEEKQFNKTLDRGLTLFEKELTDKGLTPESAFELYDTYGFPTDLTEVLLTERGFTLDTDGVEKLMEEQRQKGRAAHEAKKTVVSALDIKTDVISEFVGFDNPSVEAQILEVGISGDTHYAIVDKSPLYVEKGGQLGDTGTATLADGSTVEILGTAAAGQALALLTSEPLAEGAVTIAISPDRRDPIERHHSVTHLLHWALHQVVGDDVSQQGSYVGPDRLRFDFNSKPLSREQVTEVETLVNSKVAEATTVSWQEVEHASIKDNAGIMQFFGDKYGDIVRVVQIGGEPGALNGYSMELCGGTHVRNTSDIGLFVIKSEGAISAGIRRIEALAGPEAATYVDEVKTTLRSEIDEQNDKLAALNIQLHDEGADLVPAPEAAGDDVNEIRSQSAALKTAVLEAGKTLKKLQTAKLASQADGLIGDLIDNAKSGKAPHIVTQIEGGGAALQEFLNGLKKRQFEGVAILVTEEGGKAHLGIAVSDAHTSDFQAGSLIQELAPHIGGKGGGKPAMARGAGGDPSGIPALLEAAEALLG